MRTIYCCNIRGLGSLGHARVFHGAFVNRAVNCYTHHESLACRDSGYKALVRNLGFGVQKVTIPMALTRSVAPCATSVLRQGFNFYCVKVATFTASCNLSVRGTCAFTRVHRVMERGKRGPSLEGCGHRLGRVGVVR